MIANLEARNKRKYESEKKVDVIGTRQKRQRNMGRFEEMHVTSRHAAVSSSRHATLSSSCRPLTVPPSRCLIAPSGSCVAPCRAVVLSSRRPLTPNVTRGARDDGGCYPPPPRTSNVVVGVGLAIASPLPSPSPWMLFLALQPCRRSNRSCRRHQCPFRRPPPSPTLVAVTITITLFVAITIARPPPLSPSP